MYLLPFGALLQELRGGQRALYEAIDLKWRLILIRSAFLWLRFEVIRAGPSALVV